VKDYSPHKSQYISSGGPASVMDFYLQYAVTVAEGKKFSRPGNRTYDGCTVRYNVRPKHLDIPACATCDSMASESHSALPLPPDAYEGGANLFKAREQQSELTPKRISRPSSFWADSEEFYWLYVYGQPSDKAKEEGRDYGDTVDAVCRVPPTPERPYRVVLITYSQGRVFLNSYVSALSAILVCLPSPHAHSSARHRSRFNGRSAPGIDPTIRPRQD
jgi:hypothetical protein